MCVGIGMDAAVMESISLREKRALGSWAYVIPALGKVARYSGTDFRLTLDGKTIEAHSPLIIVSNVQVYGGVFPIGAKSLVNDGKLDVCIFKGEGFFTFVRHALKVLSRQHLQDPKVEYHQYSQISVESARALPVHKDGDPFAETPVTIRTLPSALRVIVPRDVPWNLFAD